jgi:GT2 family glycosyltransferase
VAAVTATYRRPKELERLIASLERSCVPLCGLVVVDNAGHDAVRELAERSRIPSAYLHPGSNLGCGGGLAAGERLALEKFGQELTHVWILDDDAVIEPDTLRILLEEMASGNADAAHPMTRDAAGRLGWFPGLLDEAKFREIRKPQTPEEFIARCGAEPIPFSWAQGIALLVTRRALDELGFHRSDYWVRGEDLEFSLRITHRFIGLYVPRARVAHLPPKAAAEGSRESEYPKHQAMLQNIAYTALRLPHGRRIARTIPGNWLRFLKTWGWTPRTIGGAMTAFWRGVMRGPVGTAVPSRPATADSRK